MWARSLFSDHVTYVYDADSYIYDAHFYTNSIKLRINLNFKTSWAKFQHAWSDERTCSLFQVRFLYATLLNQYEN